MFIRKMTQHGNSLTVAIPAAVCRDLELHRGDHVVGRVDENYSIVLGKVRSENLQFYQRRIDEAKGDSTRY